ncbi:hypothetical protein BJ741DRAFT_584140 [Chytriomyces cf. hyalinus JEL632]|nr:hypothetical protein BJ741DRAFT_584140 [Chytriomyces cf. hyalinus JEL632]
MNIKAKDFSSQAFWDDRFIHEEEFEWLVSSNVLADHCISTMNENLGEGATIPSLLHIGSGTSLVSNALRSKLPHAKIINLDYAQLAIEKGKRMELSQFGNIRMGWIVANLLDWISLRDALSVESMDASQASGKFDLIVEKGAADAISCGADVHVQLDDAVNAVLPPTKNALSEADRFICKLWSIVKVLNVKPIQSETTSDRASDQNASIVHTPEIFHTLYILERTRE